MIKVPPLQNSPLYLVVKINGVSHASTKSFYVHRSQLPAKYVIKYFDTVLGWYVTNTQSLFHIPTNMHEACQVLCKAKFMHECINERLLSICAHLQVSALSNDSGRKKEVGRKGLFLVDASRTNKHWRCFEPLGLKEKMPKSDQRDIKLTQAKGGIYCEGGKFKR